MSSAHMPRAQRVKALQIACGQLDCEPLLHPRFVETAAALKRASQSRSTSLLLGLSGTGKSYLADRLVRNLHPFPGSVPRLRAVRVVAPLAQPASSPLRALLVRILHALCVLPSSSSHDTVRCEFRPRPAVRRFVQRSTEPELFDAVCLLVAGRGLELLVIDEACAFTTFGADRAFDVLRDLADALGLSVVLVSSFRIVPHLTCSSALIRRVVPVILDRYGHFDARGDDYDAFRSVAASLMARVPRWARIPLIQLELRALYAGSFGCVGLLSAWWRRALLRCVPCGRALHWSDFHETALDAGVRASLRAEVALARRLQGGWCRD